MKTVLAVTMAAVRQMVWKVLLVLLVMAAVQYGLFCMTVSKTVASFSWYVDAARMDLVFASALALVLAIGCIQGMDTAGKMGYTLRRLPVSEPAIAMVWAAVHVLCYGLLWAAELLVVLLCWRRLGAVSPMPTSDLELFVEFYRSPFLHALFPLQDAAATVNGILMVLTLSLSGVHVGFAQRRGKRAWSWIVVMVIAMAVCRENAYTSMDGDLALIILWIVFLVCYIMQIWWGEYEET